MTNRENKRSLRQKIQDFMSTPKGQTIMNYAYNWGASVVIMGTLFKLTHLPGANFMLFAGMGTEVLIFFLSAFDLSGVKRDGTNAGASVSLGGNIQAGNIVSGDAVADNTEFSGMSSADDVPAGNRIAGGGPSIVVVQGGSAMQAGTPIQTGSQNISHPSEAETNPRNPSSACSNCSACSVGPAYHTGNGGSYHSLFGAVESNDRDAFPLYRAGTKCFTRHRTDEYAQQEPCRYQCYLRNAVA